MADEIEMPWSVRSRQKEGDRTEQHVVKKRGGRVHPRSGAGSIKDDGSSETEVMEIKDAMISHTLKGKDLFTLFKRAAMQGKDAVYVVYFTAFDLTATIKLTRGKG